MQNNIPEKTLEKIFHLIQQNGVDEKTIFSVTKYFGEDAGEKILKAYIQKGKVEDLDLRKLNIESIPEGLKFKRLNLYGNTTLKDLAKIEADEIDASYTNIEKIAEGLKCRLLILKGNETLEHLPKIEADMIQARDTNIETIGEGLKCKYLNLSRNKSLYKIPVRLKVSVLDLQHTFFSDQYTEDRLREKIEDREGKVGIILL